MRIHLVNLLRYPLYGLILGRQRLVLVIYLELVAYAPAQDGRMILEFGHYVQYLPLLLVDGPFLILVIISGPYLPETKPHVYHKPCILGPVQKVLRVLVKTEDAYAVCAEIGRLDRRLATLAIIAQIAPTVGLIGTVFGFIKTVLAANSQELVSRADLLGGTMEALVAAAFGLLVGVLATVMYGSLRVRLDRTVVELEAAASQVVGYLSAMKEKELSK